MNRHTYVVQLVHRASFTFAINDLQNDMSIVYVCFYFYKWMAYDLKHSSGCHSLCALMAHVTLGVIYMLCDMCVLL